MKKCLSLIIAAAMLLAMVPAMAWNLTSDPVDYTISTAADLQAFAAAVNGGNDFSGKTITLANDIDLDLSSVVWTPIGTSANRFKGTFDGNNNTISNLNISKTLSSGGEEHFGFFGYVSGATIKNVKFANSSVTLNNSSDSKKYIAVVAGYAEFSTITNVTVTNTTANITNGRFGAIAGYLYGIGVKSNPTDKYKENNITNVTVDGLNATLNSTDSPATIAGGVFAYVHCYQGSESDDLEYDANNPQYVDNYTNCKAVNMTFNATNNVEGDRILILGGIMGYHQGRVGFIISNSEVGVTMNTYGSGKFEVGGMSGRIYGGYTEYKNSTVSCTINNSSTASSNVFGGVLGLDNRDTTVVDNVNVTANISSSTGSSGGIIGAASANATQSNRDPANRKAEVKDCTVTGSISGETAGGMLGGVQNGTDSFGSSTITGNTVSAAVSGSEGKTGGIIGAVTSGNVTLNSNTNNTNQTHAPKDIGNMDDIPAGATVTGIFATPSTLDFGSHTLGSDYASKSLETTIKNLGKEKIKVLLVPSTDFDKYFEYEEVDSNPSANPSTVPSNTPPSDPVAVNLDDSDMAMNRARGVGDDGLGAGGDSAFLGTLKLRVKPKAGLSAGSYSEDIEIKDEEGNPLATVTAKITVTAPSSSGIDLWYIRGNSFGSSKSAAPTSVEIDGQPVSFVGDGREFTVSCLKPDSKWITAKWNSTSVTISFTPDASAYCSTVAIPKTGDMPLFATIAAWLGF